jgi:hypothetical protein
MGCSFETVKDMLKDAKFFENPISDRPRLERARAVGVARDVVELSDAAAKLGWSPKAVKAARSDAAVLQQNSAVTGGVQSAAGPRTNATGLVPN